MPSNVRIFLAGVLTTFVILALGFGGELLLAQSALKEPSAIKPSLVPGSPPQFA
jgi:hypothetical protein